MHPFLSEHCIQGTGLMSCCYNLCWKMHNNISFYGNNKIIKMEMILFLVICSEYFITAEHFPSGFGYPDTVECIHNI